jgi:hypothetical protein
MKKHIEIFISAFIIGCITFSIACLGASIYHFNDHKFIEGQDLIRSFCLLFVAWLVYFYIKSNDRIRLNWRS